MCIAGIIISQDPRLPLIIVNNRDEFFNRSTAPLGIWPIEDHSESPSIAASRDLARNGTWLGVNSLGSFSLLTNFREPIPNPTALATPTPATADPPALSTPATPSRGDLTANFLRSHVSPEDYLRSLNLKVHAGANLLVGRVGSPPSVLLTSNRGHLTSPSYSSAASSLHVQGASYTASLPPGVHAVSNGPLGNPWPKTERMKALLSSHLLPFLRSPRASDDLDTMDLDEMADRVFREVLWDTELCHDEARLPRTGLGIAVERILSPICIEPTRVPLPHMPPEVYGTRTSTVAFLVAGAQGTRAGADIDIEDDIDGGGTARRPRCRWVVYERNRAATLAGGAGRWVESKIELPIEVDTGLGIELDSG